MAVLRVVIPDEVAERFAQEASVRGTSTESMASEVLVAHVPAPNRSPGRAGSSPSPEELDRLSAVARRKAADPEAARFRAEMAAQRASGADPERLGRKDLLSRQRALHQA